MADSPGRNEIPVVELNRAFRSGLPSTEPQSGDANGVPAIGQGESLRGGARLVLGGTPAVTVQWQPEHHRDGAGLSPGTSYPTPERQKSEIAVGLSGLPAACQLLGPAPHGSAWKPFILR